MLNHNDATELGKGHGFFFEGRPVSADFALHHLKKCTYESGGDIGEVLAIWERAQVASEDGEDARDMLFDISGRVLEIIVREPCVDPSYSE